MLLRTIFVHIALRFMIKSYLRLCVWALLFKANVLNYAQTVKCSLPELSEITKQNKKKMK